MANPADSGSDPVFQTRAELVAWAGDVARAAGRHAAMTPVAADKVAIFADATNYIARVTLAHAHLPTGAA